MPLIIAGRGAQLVVLIVFSIIIIYAMWAAKKKLPFLRKLPAFDAMDEIVGRCAEMGKPLHFTPGFGAGSVYANEGPGLVAGLESLGYLGRLAARTGVPLIVSLGQAELCPYAEEIVRNAYTAEGKLDRLDLAYTVRFVSPIQYGYVAGVFDTLGTEKPAGNIMLGATLGEALLFGETAFRYGAMQISGGIHYTALPLNAITSDYLVIGDELFAIEAFVSKNPLQVGTLRGNDISRILSIALIILAVVAANAGLSWLVRLFSQ